MRYASEDLVKEHQGILFGLQILEQMVRWQASGQSVALEDLNEMINFLKLFADKCHHGKEEGLLFPAMEKAGIAKENGPIGQMLLEHTEGRRYLAQMTEATSQGTIAVSDFSGAATNYINLLRAHIQKENQVLFPLGDKKIPLEEQTELLEEFEEFEEKVMGAGIHEKLHRLLEKLAKKYLS